MSALDGSQTGVKCIKFADDFGFIGFSPLDYK